MSRSHTPSHGGGRKRDTAMIALIAAAAVVVIGGVAGAVTLTEPRAPRMPSPLVTLGSPGRPPGYLAAVSPGPAIQHSTRQALSRLPSPTPLSCPPATGHHDPAAIVTNLRWQLLSG